MYCHSLIVLPTMLREHPLTRSYSSLYHTPLPSPYLNEPANKYLHWSYEYCEIVHAHFWDHQVSPFARYVPFLFCLFFYLSKKLLPVFRSDIEKLYPTKPVAQNDI